MAFNFKGGTSKDFRTSFLDRKDYKENAKLENVNMLDTWYQYPNYGLLNANFEPVILNVDEDYTNLTEFGEYALTGVRGASFFVDAFNDFRQYYVSKTLSSRLEFPPLIDNIIPLKAHTDFEQAYLGYLSTLVDKYSNLLIEDLSSFRQYNQLLYNLIESNIEKFPITRSGFLLSTACPESVSGLTVELAELDYASDVEKSQLLNSYEYSCFAELASSLGFYIDKNVPWRLIANLESPVMQQYITRFKPDTTAENVLNKSFRQKTHFEDISSILYFYQSVLRNIFATLGINGTRAKRARKQIKFSQEFLISECLKIRMLETGIDMRHFSLYNNMVIDVHRIYSSQYLSNPLKPASAKIGSFCSQRIREIHEARAKIDSYSKTTIKDYN